MSRIKIEDLPIHQELTSQEQEETTGGGRFRPSIENLERRELLTGGLLNPLTPVLPGSAHTQKITSTIVTVNMGTPPAPATQHTESGITPDAIDTYLHIGGAEGAQHHSGTGSVEIGSFDWGVGNPLDRFGE